jgi:hypothetical protein
MAEEYKLNWQAPSFINTEKTADWYWVFGIIGFTLVVISIILSNYLFAILIVIASLALILHSKSEPEILDIEVSKNGIRIKDRLNPYSSYKSFWVEQEHSNPPKLLLKPRKTLETLVVYYLTDIDPADVSHYLSHYLPEEEMHEPLSQHLMEYFGF